MNRWGKILFFVFGVAIAIVVAVRYVLGGWVDYLFIPLVIALVSLAGALSLNLKFFIEFFTMRTTKHGLNMGTMILLVLAGLVTVNVLAVRKNKIWDLTEDKIFSLAQQSLEVLKPLEKPLTMTIFYRGERARGQLNEVRETLRLYQEASDKVKVEFYDSYIENQKAEEYLNSLPDKGSEQNQLFMFAEYDGKRERVQANPSSNYTETEVTSAIIRVTRKTSKKIYFLSGHGERGLTSGGEDGLSRLKEQLELYSAKAESLALVQANAIPQDASAIVIAGPESPLLSSEIELIKQYLFNGGRLLVMADPGQKHNLAPLLNSLGVEFTNTYVMNQGVQLAGASPLTVPVLDFEQQNEITKSFVNGDATMAAIFHLAGEVKRSASLGKEITVDELLRTSPTSTSITELSPQAKRGETRAYVLGLRAKGKLKNQEGKVAEKEFAAVVFGDSDFATNKLLDVPTNLNLVLNAIANLTGEADLLSIRPKRPGSTKLVMTSATWLGVVSAGVMLPTMLMILGSVVWFRRRSA